MNPVISHTQIALPLDAGTPPDAGFQLGWDHARHACVPPLEHLHPLSPIRQGWEAGRRCFGRRTLQAGRFTRAWLALRLEAWLHGLAVEETQLNPAFLRRIEVGVCPVTREALTQGTGLATDATLDRVSREAGYAAGNLLVMSRQARDARGEQGADAAMALARRFDSPATDPIGGLSSESWARLGVLGSFATPLPHSRAIELPLLVLPPPRVRVLNPAQALQVVLSLQMTGPGQARRCAELAGLMPSADARVALQTFMLTLLARRLAAGPAADAQAQRQAIEDLWRDPLVNRRWQRLALRLSPADCERVCRLAADRGLGAAGIRWLPTETATEGWALAWGGFAQAPAPRAAAGSGAQPRPRVDPARTIAPWAGATPAGTPGLRYEP